MGRTKWMSSKKSVTYSKTIVEMWLVLWEEIPGNWKHVEVGSNFLSYICMCTQAGWSICKWPRKSTLLFVAYASHLPTVSHADWIAINNFLQTALGLSSPLCRHDLLLSKFHVNIADVESLVGFSKYSMCLLCHFFVTQILKPSSSFRTLLIYLQKM